MFQPALTTSHAIRALAVLAEGGDVWQRGNDVAEKSRVPRPFLAKLFHRLARERLVEARRGRDGGYRLAAPPRAISLLDVVRAVEGDDVFHRCQLGAGRCTADRRCPLHAIWSSRERPRLLRLYRQVTLERLARFQVWNLPTRAT